MKDIGRLSLRKNIILHHMWHMLPVTGPYIKKENSSNILNTGIASAVYPLSKYNLSMAIELMLKELTLNKLKFREVPFGSHLGNGYAFMEILSKLSLIFIFFSCCSWHTEDSFGSKLDVLDSREKTMKKTF